MWGVIKRMVTERDEISHWGITQHSYFGHSSALPQTHHLLHSVLGQLANFFPSGTAEVDGEGTPACRGASRAPLTQGVPLPGGRAARLNGDGDSRRQQIRSDLCSDTSQQLHLSSAY